MFDTLYVAGKLRCPCCSAQLTYLQTKELGCSLEDYQLAGGEDEGSWHLERWGYGGFKPYALNKTIECMGQCPNCEVFNTWDLDFQEGALVRKKLARCADGRTGVDMTGRGAEALAAKKARMAQ